MWSIIQRGTSYFEMTNENQIVTSEYPIDPSELLGEKQFERQTHFSDEIGSPVQEFFRDATVFITGGTGFLGKSLIEKMLRSCPHIKHIYLLIRDKKGQSSQERLNTMLRNRIFNRLKQEVGDFSHKISIMNGDLGQPELGLSESDKKIFFQEVNIIYHNGANVRFNEKLKISFIQNVISTREIIKLAKMVENLKALMHVSTAYSFCIESKIEEKVYDEFMDYQETMNQLFKMSDEEMEEKKKEIIGKWPNSYTFTKALAECLVKNESHGLPIAIFRPSVVISTYKEPVCGWIDNFNGPFGLICSAVCGITHTFFLDKNAMMFDMVPVDLVTNCLICITKETNEKFLNSSKSDDLVYFFCSGAYNLMNFYTFEKSLIKHIKTWPFNNAVWSYFLITTHNKYYYEILKFFLHTIPASIYDQFSLLKGKKPMLKKHHYMIDVLTRNIVEYFLENEWIFVNSNTHNAWKNLSKEDKSIFFFNIEELSWDGYYEAILLGIRVYLLNDDVESLPIARKKWRRLRFANMVVMCLLVVLLMYLIWAIIHYIRLYASTYLYF